MTTRPSESTALGSGPAVPWGLAAIAAVAVVLTLKSLLSDWVSTRVMVLPELREELQQGFTYFGVRGTGFAVGLVVLIVLVGLALWLPGRLRAGLAWSALALAVLLLVDALLMWLQVAELRLDSATAVVDVQREMWDREEVPELIALDISAQGLYVGAFAILLLGLVAALLPRPERSPWVQAGLGAVGALVVLPLPWVQAWSSIQYQLRVDNVWLWSRGVEGVLLGLGTVTLVALTLLTLRTPGYARGRWALASVVLCVLLFFSAVAADVQALQDVHELGSSSDVAVLDAKSTGMLGLLAASAALLGVAAARAYWRGREEEPPPADGSWLPGGIRDRRS
ncbi:MAG: hypothetical protein ACRDTM_14665 [Micromonosporaceae bacterium]